MRDSLRTTVCASSFRLLMTTAFVLLVQACSGGSGGDSSSSAPPPAVPPPTTSPPVAELLPLAVFFPALASAMEWVPQHRLMYLALPSLNGPAGNAVIAVDPLTSQVVHRAEAGSEPALMAATDDGQFLYVVLAGSSRVQRYTLPELRLDMSFTLPRSRSGGDTEAQDISAIPGQPRSLLVSLKYGPFLSEAVPITDLMVFDDGVARPDKLDRRCLSLAMPGPGDKVLCGTNAGGISSIYEVRIRASGVYGERLITNALSWRSLPIRYEPSARVIYTQDGKVIDPSDGRLVASVDAIGPTVWDAARQRLHVAVDDGVIRSFDTRDFSPIRPDTPYNPASGRPVAFVKWGDRGLALSGSDRLTLLYGGMGVPSFDSSLPGGAARERILAIGDGRLAWDPAGARLYVTLRSAAGDPPDSVAEVDPIDLRIVRSRVVGPRLNALAVSDDGNHLYVGVDGEATVRRLRLPSLEPELTIHVRENWPGERPVAREIRPAPGRPGTVAVQPGRLDPPWSASGPVQIFDDDVLRPGGPPDFSGLASFPVSADGLTWTADGNRLLAVGLSSLYSMRVGSDGQQALAAKYDNEAAGRLQLDRGTGWLLTESGLVLDPDSFARLGSFGANLWPGPTSFSVDDTSGIVYAIQGRAAFVTSADYAVVAYDLRRFTPQRVYPLDRLGFTRDWRDFTAIGAGRVVFRSEHGLHLVQLEPAR